VWDRLDAVADEDLSKKKWPFLPVAYHAHPFVQKKFSHLLIGQVESQFSMINNFNKFSRTSHIQMFDHEILK
jgi:hypothetical protein